MWGVVVVVVGEAARCDLDVEEPPDAGGAEDALRGSSDLCGVFEAAVSHPALQGQQVGLRAGDDLGSAGVVSPGAGVGLDDHGACAVGEGDVSGPAAVLGHLDPGGVVVDGFEGLATGAVAAQPRRQHVVEPGCGDRVHVGR